MAKVDLSIMISAIDQASTTFAKIGTNAKQTWNDIGKSIEDANNKTRDMVAGLEQVGSKMAIVGAAVLGVGYAGVTASMELEGYRSKLEVAMKDTKAAADMYQWAKEMAAKTPFEMKSVVDAVVRLQMYGLEAKEWFGMVGNMAGAMGKDVTQAVEAVADAVSGGGLERLKEFGITGSMLKDAGWSGGYQTVEDINSLKAALQSVMTERFGGGMDKMMGTAAGAVSNFKDAIFNLRAAIGDALTPTIKEITPYITKIADSMTELAKSPAGRAMTIIAMAFGLILFVGGGLLIFFAQLIGAFNTIAGVMGGAGGAFGWFGRILMWFRGLWPLISGAVAAWAATLGPVILGALGSAGAAIMTGITAIGTFLAGLPLLIIGAIVLAIVALGVGIWQLVKHWDTVKAWFGNIGANMSEWLGGVWDAIAQFFSNIPYAIGEWLGNAYNNVTYWVGFIIGAFQAMPGAIAQWLGEAWTNIKQWVVDSYNSFVEWAQNVPTVIGDALVNIYNSVVAWAQSLPGAIADGINSFVDTIKQGFADAWSAVTGFFTGIYDYLRELPGRMWQSAKDAASAFINGFKAGNEGGASGGMSAGQAAGQAAFGGYRAAGGAVRAGTAYVVGEKGPELFMPGANGSVVPNGMAAKMAAISSGSGGIDITLHTDGSFSTVTSGGLQDAVVRVVNDMQLKPARSY